MKTTLDAWEVLHAVVQLGGFAPAAEHLHRSQSTISYAIARLQEQLGVKLFELKGRKAELTEAGRALLADAEPHLMGFHQLEQRAHSLASGGESEIRLSVDSLFPNDRLFAALGEFSAQFPYVRTKLRQATLLSADAEFSSFNCHLCITGLISREFFVKPLLDVRMIAVAHKRHPLHAHKHKLSRAELLRHMLVIVEGTGAPVRQQPRSPAQRSLTVNTIEAAIDAVRAGLCFGWLPRYRVQTFIERGELTPLRMSVGHTRESRLNLVYQEIAPRAREVSALADLLGLSRGVETV